jgi:hypothetical protein
MSMDALKKHADVSNIDVVAKILSWCKCFPRGEKWCYMPNTR